MSPTPWQCKADTYAYDWSGVQRWRCHCHACHPLTLQEALPLVLLVVVGVLLGTSVRVWPLLPETLRELAERLHRAQRRNLGQRRYGWHALRTAWEDLHEALSHARDHEEAADNTLRELLQVGARSSLDAALEAVALELASCAHPDAAVLPLPELVQFVRGLPEPEPEGARDVRGQPWDEVKDAFLVLSGLMSAPAGVGAVDAGATATPRASIRALVRTCGTLFPYLVDPSLEGEAFGDRERAHRFASFAAAGAWVDRNGGILMTYTIEPAPEDVSGRFTGQRPNNDRATDPAPPSAELLAELAEGGRAPQRLEHAHQPKAEIGAARAAGGALCA